MKPLKIATFDLETDNLYPAVTRLWCCVTKDHSSGTTFVWHGDDVMGLLAHLDTFDVLVGHNCIAFDFPVLRKLFGYEYHGKKVDTLIMSRTQRPNRVAPKGTDSGPHSVEAWALRLGRKKIANEVWNTFHPTILERCKEDVEIQYALYHALLAEGKGEGWAKAHRLNNKLFDYLQRQEDYGWTVDRDLIDKHIATLNRGISCIDERVSPELPIITEKLEKDDKYVNKPFKQNGEYTTHCVNYWGADSIAISGRSIVGPYCRVNFRYVDLDSNKEVKQFLLNLGWKPLEWNENDEGKHTSPKLSKDDPFEGIQSSLGKRIAKRVQCKQRVGILEGWRELIRDDGRVPTAVGGIASTGRLKHRGIVNVPSPHSHAFFAKRMRSVFIAKPGWVLVGVDSKGNQVRQLAARMGDKEFTDAVLFGNANDGTDLHSLNQRRSGAPSRSKAKNFFYGFIFGAGAEKIATTIDISVAAAKALIANYLKELPLLKKLIDKLVAEWRATAQKRWSSYHNKWIYFNGYITGLDGRPILVDSEHKILCYALQSDEAIQMGAAYVKFHFDMAKAGYVLHKDWGMLIWVHDEFQVECRPEIAQEVARIGCNSIKWAGEFYGIACPHEGEAKIGQNWFETH